jgi:hypothetical protein
MTGCDLCRNMGIICADTEKGLLIKVGGKEVVVGSCSTRNCSVASRVETLARFLESLRTSVFQEVINELQSGETG